MRPSILVFVLSVALSAAGGYWLGARSAASPSSPLPPAPKPPEPSVARWSGGQLTAPQLQARVVALKTAAGLGSLDASQAQAFADAAIQTALLAAEARGRGLENDARVQGPMADLLARRLIEVDVEGARRPASEAEVKAYYEAHRGDFVRPERVRLTVVAIKAPRGDSRARAKAKTELEALRAEMAKLPGLAVNEAVKKHGGQPGALEALTREELEAKLGQQAAGAAWLMMNLERPELLETDDAVLVARLEAREAAREVALEQARAQIESRLWYEQRDAVLAQQLQALRAKLKLEVDEASLKKALSEVR